MSLASPWCNVFGLLVISLVLDPVSDVAPVNIPMPEVVTKVTSALGIDKQFESAIETFTKSLDPREYMKKIVMEKLGLEGFNPDDTADIIQAKILDLLIQATVQFPFQLLDPMAVYKKYAGTATSVAGKAAGLVGAGGIVNAVEDTTKKINDMVQDVIINLIITTLEKTGMFDEAFLKAIRGILELVLKDPDAPPAKKLGILLPPFIRYYVPEPKENSEKYKQMIDCFVEKALFRYAMEAMKEEEGKARSLVVGQTVIFNKGMATHFGTGTKPIETSTANAGANEAKKKEEAKNMKDGREAKAPNTTKEDDDSAVADAA